MLSHVGIDSTEGIIQQIDIGISIHGSGQAYTSFLTSGQVDASLAYLGVMSGG